MKALLKKLWGDRRGNALVIAGAALPLIVGSAGLASDTIHWALWKRQMQRAADSAALAGVYARAQGENHSTAVTRDLSRNDHVVPNWHTGFPIVTTPANSGTWTHQVQVELAVRQKLGFSSLFLSSAPIIRTSARAAMVPDGNYCVVALAPTGSGLILGGSADVDMGCGAIANSTDPTSSVNTNGTAYNFVADPVAAAGGMPTSINGATDLQPYHVALPDPYAGQYPTTPSTPCQNFNQLSSNQTNTISPGCFNSFSPGNGTWTMEPGVYFLNNTSLNLNGQTRLVGEGVTIILTGSSPGTITMNGQSSVSLTAPTDETCLTVNGVNSCNYKNMLLIQAPNATQGNNNLINGDNNSFFDGAFYFPRGDVQFTGSSENATQCAMVVAYTVEFTGNNNLQNAPDDCDADTQVSGKAIRLVA